MQKFKLFIYLVFTFSTLLFSCQNDALIEPSNVQSDKSPSESSEVLSATPPPTWQLMPGRAKDIGAGGNTANNPYIFIIGDRVVQGGYELFRWTGSAWRLVPGIGCVKVDVDPQGRPWVITDNNNIFRLDNNLNENWIQVPGKARDIGISRNGTVYIIGTTPVSGAGYQVLRYTPQGWVYMNGAGVSVSASNSGQAWITNSSNNIYTNSSLNPSDIPRWIKISGGGKDIGIGGVSSGFQSVEKYWLIGSTPVPGGYGIYQYGQEVGEWIREEGGAVKIDVDASGKAWIVNASGYIYKYSF